MYLVRSTSKTDYCYYLKAFKKSHFKLYSNNITIDNLEEYIINLVITKYSNVYRFVIEKEDSPIGFFHLYNKEIDTIEISMGLFKSYNSIYGAYIVALSIQKAFSFEHVTQVIATIDKNNLVSQKIVMSLGAKEGVSLNNKNYLYLKKNDFPNDFFRKIINRIKINEK